MFRTVSPSPCKQFNRESKCRHAEVSWQEHTTPVVLQNKCWQTKQLQHISISIYIYISIYIQTCFCFKSQTAPNILLSISLSASHQRHIYLIKCQQVQTTASFTDLHQNKTNLFHQHTKDFQFHSCGKEHVKKVWSQTVYVPLNSKTFLF